MNSDDTRIQQHPTPVFIVHVALDHNISREMFTDSVYDIVDKIPTPLSVNVINGPYIENSASYRSDRSSITYRQIMVTFNIQGIQPHVDPISARNAVFSLVEHFSTHYKYRSHFYELPVTAYCI